MVFFSIVSCLKVLGAQEKKDFQRTRMKLREIAKLIDGEVIGDPETEIKGVAGISDASEGDITFLINTKFIKECAESRASCVIVKDMIPDIKSRRLRRQIRIMPLQSFWSTFMLSLLSFRHKRQGLCSLIRRGQAKM